MKKKKRKNIIHLEIIIKSSQNPTCFLKTSHCLRIQSSHGRLAPPSLPPQHLKRKLMDRFICSRYMGLHTNLPELYGNVNVGDIAARCIQSNELYLMNCKAKLGPFLSSFTLKSGLFQHPSC